MSTFFFEVGKESLLSDLSSSSVLIVSFVSCAPAINQDFSC